MSEELETTTAPAGESGEATEAGLDLSPLMERLDEVASDFGSRLDRVEHQLAGEAEQEEPSNPWDELFQSEEDEEAGLDQRELLQALRQAAEQATQQQVQQAVAPLLQRVEALTIEQAARDLEARYPDLRDPEVAKDVVGHAQEWAARMGMPDAARHPVMVEMAYLASRARQAAQSEVPAGDGNVRLEGGGGAPQQQAPSEEDIGRGIVSAFGGGSFWR